MNRIKKITRFGTVYFDPVLTRDDPLFDELWEAALEEAQHVPDELSEMPPNSIIRMEGSTKSCKTCGSSLRWFSDHCIQPECDNYAPAKGFKR